MVDMVAATAVMAATFQDIEVDTAVSMLADTAADIADAGTAEQSSAHFSGGAEDMDIRARTISDIKAIIAPTMRHNATTTMATRDPTTVIQMVMTAAARAIKATAMLVVTRCSNLAIGMDAQQKSAAPCATIVMVGVLSSVVAATLFTIVEFPSQLSALKQKAGRDTLRI